MNSVIIVAMIIIVILVLISIYSQIKDRFSQKDPMIKKLKKNCDNDTSYW